MKCDTCGRESDTKVLAGRWLFYCSDNPVCKAKEKNHIYENELLPDIESGDYTYTLNHGLEDELLEAL